MKTQKEHPLKEKQSRLAAHPEDGSDRLQLWANATQIGVFLVGPEQQIRFANDTFQRITGAHSDLTGILLEQAWPEAMVFLAPLLNAVERSGQPRRIVDQPIGRVRASRGETAYFTFTITHFEDPGSQQQNILVLVAETTEEVLARQAMTIERDRLRALLENNLDVVYRRDLRSDRYDYMSPVVERVLGYTVDEMNAMTFDEVMLHIHPEDRSALAQGLAEVEQTGQGLFEYRFRVKDGRYRWLADHVTLLRDEYARPLYRGGILRDITTRRETEEALKSYSDQLARSNRDLENFAFIASHDLQEPMRKIISFGGILQQRLGDQLDDESADILQRMQNAALRMQAMIRDLLDLSRVNTRGQAFVQVDLNKVAAEVISDLEGAILRTDGQVQVGLLPSIEADPLQVRQLLQNLIGNGLKFHRPGVPPVVQVVGMLTSEGPLPADGFIPLTGTHRSDDATSWVKLTVSDNGIGFDMQYLDRILQPFQRLNGRSMYEGTGMGLAICKRIVERHHGTISAFSRPNEGAAFTVILPARQNS